MLLYPSFSDNYCDAMEEKQHRAHGIFQLGNYSSYAVSYQTQLASRVTPSFAPPVSPLSEDEMDITYNQLLEHHKTRLTQERESFSEQVLRNHTSALKAYLVFCGKDLSQRVSREFTADFLKRMQEFAQLISGGNRKTAADKLSMLRAIKKTVDTLHRKAQLAPVSGISMFHKELRLAVASSGQTPEEIAKAIGAAPLTLPRWMDGANPVKKGMPTLRRLERHLGLERGFLESKLEYPRKETRVAMVVAGDRYIERMRSLVKDPFYLPRSEFSCELKAEWFALLRYKTAEHPVGLRRSPRGRWRVLAKDQVGPEISSEQFCCVTEGYYSPSASRNFQIVRAFLGFLSKPKEGNTAVAGLGLPVDKVQTLAHLVIPENLEGYLQFMKARSGHTIHNGHINVAGAVCNLTNPGDGYLWQHPQLLEKVQEFARDRTWQQLCDETHSLCKSWQQAGKGKKSRDPKAPLLHLLSLDDPLVPFKRAIKQLDIAAANCAPGSAFQATYKRDALLVAISLSNPLRHRTLTIMKYIKPGEFSAYASNLYQAEDGTWRLRFWKGDFKNDGSKDDDYDAPLPKALASRIEEYLDVYRPVLIRRNLGAPWVFPNLHGNMHKDVGQLMACVAQNYIPEVSRLRMHAVRHIVATDFLNRNPGHYTVVAALLHDKLETVLKHYAHRKSESAFNLHEEHMRSFFAED